MSKEKLEKKTSSLEKNIPSSLLLYQLESLTDLSEEDGDTPSEKIQQAAVACSKFIWSLNKKCEGMLKPFEEVEGTKGQTDSESWSMERSKCSTAFDCKTFLGLSSGQAKKNYLRKKIWRLDRVETAAMKYGKQMEGPARKVYAEKIKKVHSSLEVIEAGLWKNPKYPTLACSPDGFIVSTKLQQPILLEIKCLSKEYIDPKHFEDQMTTDEIKRFYLVRNEEGLIELRKTHAYYYQIQMSLLELNWCHLMVFSDAGDTIVPVQRDIDFWAEKRERLIKKHRELLVPEHILKRTVRHRHPLELVYPKFHEEPHDNFFSNNEE
ncbi:hypothetical protein FOCC_FOCC012390 [Frankliniella occidentalis]|nr:hypothetical protein FOCC_FOCC012390 [Frankliniella occidentalis]